MTSPPGDDIQTEVFVSLLPISQHNGLVKEALLSRETEKTFQESNPVKITDNSSRENDRLNKSSRSDERESRFSKMLDEKKAARESENTKKTDKKILSDGKTSAAKSEKDEISSGERLKKTSLAKQHHRSRPANRAPPAIRNRTVLSQYSGPQRIW